MEPTPARPIRRSLRVAGMTPMQPAADYIMRTTLAPPSIAAISTPSKRVAGGASEAAYRALLPPTGGRRPPVPLLGSYYIGPTEEEALAHQHPPPALDAEPRRPVANSQSREPEKRSPVRPAHKKSPTKGLSATRLVPRHVPAATATVRARRLFADEQSPPPPQTMPVAKSLFVTLRHAARLYWRWMTGAVFIAGALMLMAALASLDWRPDGILDVYTPPVDNSVDPERVVREAQTINANFRALRDQVLKLEDAMRQVGTMAIDGDARLGKMLDDTTAAVLRLQEENGCTEHIAQVEQSMRIALESLNVTSSRIDGAFKAVDSVSTRLDERFSEAMAAVRSCSAASEARVAEVVAVHNRSHNSVEDRIAAAIDSPSVAAALAAKVAALVPERVVGRDDAAAMRHVVAQEVAIQRRAADDAAISAGLESAVSSALDSRLRHVPDRDEVQRVVADVASRVEARVESRLVSAFGRTRDAVPSMLQQADEMVDYALLTMGARPDEAHTSPPFVPRPSHWLFGSWAARMASHGPHVALSPNTAPGACWAFAGATGNLTVQLAKSIRPTHVTIDHVAPLAGLDRRSAPRAVRVQSDGEVLAEIEYLLDGPPAQTFGLRPLARLVDRISFDFMSNHGRTEYTCVYRVRVHSV